MNRKLKSFASNLMLVTGIITSIAGVIETVLKLILSFSPKPKNISVEKSFRIPEFYDFPPELPPPPESFLTQHWGVVLIVVGVLVIAFALLIIKRLKR